MIDQLQSFTVDKLPTNDPRVVYIDGEPATAIIDAIASDTARKIMATLHDDPQPPSRIAESVDTSIANVNYHLDNLQAAGLIETVDTWYSEKGKEMQVYAPTDDPIVFAGTEERTGQVRTLLQQVGTAMVALVAVSALVQWFVSNVLVRSQGSTTLRKATSAGTIEGLNVTPIPPGVLFFTGGTFVLSLAVLVWYVARIRR